jgi:LPS export ABC transporter permease LptF/LPS export ABC transporter permease LptG
VKTLDRYILKQTAWPAVLGLLVFTFVLIIPTVLEFTEELVAKGVPGPTILHLLATLLPSALGLAIPMALLLGLLIGFGRLSSDREWVAMQACGISLLRLLRPVLLLSGLAAAATLYLLLAALPQSNQAFREIMFRILSEQAEGEVKPRVFFKSFPGAVLYVREVPQGGGWRDVFLATGDPGKPRTAHVAREGRVVIDRGNRKVEIVLEQGSTHMEGPDGSYRPTTWDRTILRVDPETIFPSVGPAKGEREMSLRELRDRIADRASLGLSTESAYVEIHKKFSIPAACLVLGLFGLALGASNRREGRLSSLLVGVLVIYTYYALLENASNLARGDYLRPWVAAWLPNLAFGVAGATLLIRRHRAIDRPVSLARWVAAVPDRWRRRRQLALTMGFPAVLFACLPGVRLLDRYVVSGYIRIFFLSVGALVGLFHISTFIDLSDEVLRGESTWGMLFRHLWFATPQALYYVLPISVLLATLVTVGLLTRHSELVVMKACGVSLYRVSAPLILVATIVAGLGAGMQETLLGPSNYRAEAIRHVLRGRSPDSFNVIRRQWVAAANGDIYHYGYFDPSANTLVDFDSYHVDYSGGGLARNHVARASYAADQGAWIGTDGWARTFANGGTTYTTFDQRVLPIEPPAYFSTRTPDPDFMNYLELTKHVDRLEEGGFDMTRQRVALERKLSFPLAAVIMAMIAIPFATATGKHGAMYGIGLGLVLAFGYWGSLGVFGAMGAAMLMTPLLAAWAPNILFASGAAYLLLTVRT